MNAIDKYIVGYPSLKDFESVKYFYKFPVLVFPSYSYFLEQAMNGRKALKVDNSFRVEGFKNIFAMGDCTSLEEPKIGALAMRHGEVMAKTILNLHRNKPPAVYKPGSSCILCYKMFYKKYLCVKYGKVVIALRLLTQGSYFGTGTCY